MSRQRIAAALVALSLSPVSALYATDDKPPVAESGQVGSSASDFTLKDSYGKEFRLADYKDRVVVLEWVNQDCPVSKGKHTKKVMQDTYAKYVDKVVWLGIDTTAGRQAEGNRVYAAKMGIAYPVLLDADGKVGRSYGARTTPHMFVIAKGKLVYAGAIDDGKDGGQNYIAAALDEVLAGKPVSKAKTEPYGCKVKYPPG